MKKDTQHILLIEDEKPLCKVLQERLELQADVQVHLAYDGKEGLKKAIEVQPKLIILDLLMPTMNGIEFLQDLRKSPKIKDTAVVVFTNVTDKQKLDALEPLGVYDAILKLNWDTEEVIERILYALEAANK